MKKVTKLTIGPLALLVLLAMLTLLVVKRKHITVEEAADYAGRAVVQAENTLRRDKYALVAVLALMSLLVFVTWTAVRADQREDEAMPPAGRGDSIPPSSQ
jgi:hypothetical protein